MYPLCKVTKERDFARRIDTCLTHDRSWLENTCATIATCSTTTATGRRDCTLTGGILCLVSAFSLLLPTGCCRQQRCCGDADKTDGDVGAPHRGCNHQEKHVVDYDDGGAGDSDGACCEAVC